MAPLPVSHRPLSMDSRDTSMSNSSSRPVDTSAESGSASGFSLPLRGTRTNSTPDSPSTIEGTIGNSNDYLIPGKTTKSPGGTTTTNVSRPSLGSMDSSDLGDSTEVLRGSNGRPAELETSFTRSPRRTDGYTSLPQNEQLPSSNPGRITNKSYGLGGHGSTPSSRRNHMSGSRSTQPLLESPTSYQPGASSPTMEVPPRPPPKTVITPSNGKKDTGNYSTRPLPPTPTDQVPALSDESPMTPSTSLPLDPASLRSNQTNLIPNYQYRLPGASPSGLGNGAGQREGVPFTINADGKTAASVDPANEISV